MKEETMNNVNQPPAVGEAAKVINHRGNWRIIRASDNSLISGGYTTKNEAAHAAKSLGFTVVGEAVQEWTVFNSPLPSGAIAWDPQGNAILPQKLSDILNSHACLIAENKALREALERIAAYDAPDAHAMIQQARAALASPNQ